MLSKYDLIPHLTRIKHRPKWEAIFEGLDAQAVQQVAERIMQERVDEGEICVWNEGFEATDDVEVSTSGEETNAGEIQYF
jgi:UDP-N-acetyl-D-mannosaminuronic acid transferase (WecB/TagA/CpsF family)